MTQGMALSPPRFLRSLMQTVNQCLHVSRKVWCNRANDAVHRSDGRVRPEAYGGRARYAFARLPGVGAATAKRWYDLGYRCPCCGAGPSG